MSVLLKVCIGLCLLNIIFVSSLASAGVLKTVERGDIRYTNVDEMANGEFVLPSDTSDRFAVERPTDADAFYNMVIRVRNGGPMYNPGGGSDVQNFHYHSMAYFLFAPLAQFGYVPFKILWLIVSLLCSVTGTWLFLTAELNHYASEVSNWGVWLLSGLSIGFQPFVANFKVGQTAPIMFFFLAVVWYLFRRGADFTGGGALVGAVMFKPYVGAPLAIYSRVDRLRGISGFLVTYMFLTGMSLVIWGFDTIFAYYDRIIDHLLREGTTVTYDSFAAWSPSQLRVLYWSGPLEPIIIILIILPVTVVFYQYVVEDSKNPIPLFVLSIVTVLFVFRAPSAIDMALVFGPILILGVRYYSRNDELALLILVMSFFGFMAHEYVLEILVGWGPENLRLISRNEDLILMFLPMLQPGVYGLFMLYGLTLIKTDLISGNFMGEFINRRFE